MRVAPRRALASQIDGEVMTGARKFDVATRPRADVARGYYASCRAEYITGYCLRY